MAILEIIKDPSPVLRKKAKPVEKINASVKKLLDDMAATMYEAPGVGLAAPQVNVSKRIVVIDPGEDGWGLIEMINPEILVKEEFGVVGPEGCLSIPGMLGDVIRFGKIRVTYLDRNGRQQWLDAADWPARIIQHEIDHLDGILYTDTCTNYRPAPKPEDEEEGEVDPEAAAIETAVAADEAADGAHDRPTRWQKTVEKRRKLRRTIDADAPTESGAGDAPSEE